MEQLLFDLTVPHSKLLSKFTSRLSPKTLARHSPSARLSRFIQQKCINCVSVLYKARENCIYTCKNIYLRVIHLIIQFTNILLQFNCRQMQIFYTNIAAKKANELYNCELYNCSEIQFSLALYNKVYILCFCFCIKREKNIYLLAIHL